MHFKNFSLVNMLRVAIFCFYMYAFYSLSLSFSHTHMCTNIYDTTLSTDVVDDDDELDWKKKENIKK